MNSERRGRRNIPWSTISAEDWAKGYAHVGRLMGVTRAAARFARQRLSRPAQPAERRKWPVPEGLKPTDSPTEVAKKHGVSVPTASRWLASVGRPPGRPGRRWPGRAY